jgi:hypothetical protein
MIGLTRLGTLVVESAETIGLYTLAAASVAAVAPILSLIVNAKLRHKEKLEDYARQDIVAAQAAQAAALLLAAQAKTTSQNVETQGKLNQIHTLVNSNLTKEMGERLVSLRAQVILSREVIRLNRHNGLEPDEAARSALSNLETAVSSLETALRERGNATVRADSEQT